MSSGFFIPDGRDLDDIFQGRLGGGLPNQGPQFYAAPRGGYQDIFDLRYARRPSVLSSPPFETGYMAFDRDISCYYKTYTRPTYAFNANLIPSIMYGGGDPSWGGVGLRLGPDFVRGEIFAMVQANTGPTTVQSEDYHLGFLKAARIDVNVRPRWSATATGFHGPTGWVNLSDFRQWSYTVNGGFLEIFIEFRSLDGAFANTTRLVTMRNSQVGGGSGGDERPW